MLLFFSAKKELLCVIKVPLSCGAPIREGGRRIGNYTGGGGGGGGGVKIASEKERETHFLCLADWVFTAKRRRGEEEGIILIKINCGRMPPREEDEEER